MARRETTFPEEGALDTGRGAAGQEETRRCMADHREWLGYVQPTGVVVSIPALMEAQAYVDRNALPLQRRFRQCLPQLNDWRGPQRGFAARPAFGQAAPEIPDFAAFAHEFLGWPAEYIHGSASGPPLPDDLAVPLPDDGEILRPTHALAEPEPAPEASRWTGCCKRQLVSAAGRAGWGGQGRDGGPGREGVRGGGARWGRS